MTGWHGIITYLAGTAGLVAGWWLRGLTGKAKR